MEASALQVPASVGRLSVTIPLLRLRSDEQLVALFRAGSDDAFSVLHDRYRQRLFAYVRQMLSGASRQDAEDVLQDVFVRAYGALRADERAVNVRAWLYRVAHNRCIDHLRRPIPAPVDLFETSRKPLHDPIEEAQRREDLRRLVADVARLPEHQRSALLMRELDGLSYQDLAHALDVTVPAVKSLLVRARVGLVEAAEARDTACCEIRRDLAAAYDRGVKASGRARRHMRECSGCREYRTALRGVRRSFAALLPGGLGPLAIAANAIGLGGAGGGAAAGSAMTAGGSAAASTALAGATACKVAAAVCTAAITAGGAVEVSRLAESGQRPAREARSAAKSTAGPAAPAGTRPAVAAPVTAVAVREPATSVSSARPVTAGRPARGKAKARSAPRKAAAAPVATAPLPVLADDDAGLLEGGLVPLEDSFDGGAAAPAEPVAEAVTTPTNGTGAAGGVAGSAPAGTVVGEAAPGVTGPVSGTAPATAAPPSAPATSTTNTPTATTTGPSAHGSGPTAAIAESPATAPATQPAAGG